MTRHGTLVFLVSLLSFASGPPMHAQVRPLAAGQTFKLFLQSQSDPVEGTLSSVGSSEGTLSLKDGGTRALSPEDVARAEVLRTRRRTLRGALIGGGAGLVIGALAVATSEDECDGESLCETASGTLNGAVLVFTPLIGAGIGAIVGALIKSEESVPALVPEASRDRSSLTLSWSVPIGH